MPELPEIATLAPQLDQPCPACGAPIEKIKTGGTSSFICPTCQK